MWPLQEAKRGAPGNFLSYFSNSSFKSKIILKNFFNSVLKKQTKHSNDRRIKTTDILSLETNALILYYFHLFMQISIHLDSASALF